MDEEDSAYMPVDPGLLLNKFPDIMLIDLEGGLRATLDWKAARQRAIDGAALGKGIFWKIHLGLFSQLFYPLENQMQHQSLKLSLEHFKETLWSEFKERTVGLCIYQGDLDFSLHFPWDELQQSNFRLWLKEHFGDSHTFHMEMHEPTGAVATEDLMSIDTYALSSSPAGKQLVRLFCRDACAEYLTLLTNHLPDALPLFVLMDNTLDNPLYIAQLASQERFDRLHVALRKSPMPAAFTWDIPSGSTGNQTAVLATNSHLAATVGVCLPAMHLCRPSHYLGLELALTWLLQNKVDFRLVPEGMLTSGWDGLDYLLVVPSGLSAAGTRMLRGFCAAGGTVVIMDAPDGKALNLPLMTPFAEWCKNR